MKRATQTMARSVTVSLTSLPVAPPRWSVYSNARASIASATFAIRAPAGERLDDGKPAAIRAKRSGPRAQQARTRGSGDYDLAAAVRRAAGAASACRRARRSGGVAADPGGEEAAEREQARRRERTNLGAAAGVQLPAPCQRPRELAEGWFTSRPPR